MLTKHKARNLILPTVILYIIICAFMLYMSNDKFDGISIWLLYVTALVVSYISMLVYLVLGQEIYTNRVRLWVSLPSSRLEYIRRIYYKMLIYSTVMALPMYTVTIIMISIRNGILPLSIPIIGLGITQLTLVVLALCVLVTILVRSKYAVLVGIIFSVVRIFSFTKTAFNNRTPYGCWESLGKAELFIPLGAGYRNIVYGHYPRVPGNPAILIFDGIGDVFNNVYPFLWAFVMWGIVAYIISHKDY